MRPQHAVDDLLNILQFKSEMMFDEFLIKFKIDNFTFAFFEFFSDF